MRAHVVDPNDGSVLDDVVATRYRRAGVVHGRRLLEITTHGGLSCTDAVLAAAIRAGARQAEPGEFTRRAVLNGKLDLLQAEAIGDLVDARSRAAQRGAPPARRRPVGRVLALRERILQVEALLAYDIDFPEEDDGPIPRERITLAARAALDDVRDAARDGRTRARLIHDGALVVLAGAPNVGQVVAVQRAARRGARDRDRDSRHDARRDRGGARPTALAAAARRHGGPARHDGRARALGNRDVGSLSRSCGAGAGVRRIGEPGASTRRDRSRDPHRRARTRRAHEGRFSSRTSSNAADIVAVSARTGEGLGALLDAIDARLAVEHGTPPSDDAPGLTRARHRAAAATCGRGARGVRRSCSRRTHCR